jgi:hypothetical protein
VQPYFTLDGNVCARLATKDHVNLFHYDSAIVPDPDNTNARMISFYPGTAIRRQHADDDAAPDRRQQPRRRLAQDQAALTIPRQRSQPHDRHWAHLGQQNAQPDRLA